TIVLVCAEKSGESSGNGVKVVEWSRGRGGDSCRLGGKSSWYSSSLNVGGDGSTVWNFCIFGPCGYLRTNYGCYRMQVVQIVLWYVDSSCSKHMTGDRSQFTNFINKFLGTVKFGNDHVAKIMGYGDYQIGNVMISRVYYVEGLGHNLFSVRQFCDSNLEVAFHQHTCYIRNLEGVDLLTRSQGNNLYTLSLGDMMLSSPICLLSKASKTNSWLWHRRLSHLNFSTINQLSRHSLVREAIATTCYTQNRSIIRLFHIKTPYELLHDKLPDLSFFYVFGAVRYLKNDSENLGKLQPKADIGYFIGYALTKKAFWIYNRCTRRIIEPIHVDFDELTTMASEHSSSKPTLLEMILQQSVQDSCQTLLRQHPPELITPITEVVAPEPAASTSSPSSTTVDQDAPSPSNSQTTPET
nr:integrase, catalytic region, zinc finger, CCHC-type, peptidase aspartic, catalytic [Tanacetum cinerariifolium]